MKKMMTLALALAIAGPTAAPAFANDMMMDPGKKADMMKAKLALTDEQASQVKDILKEYGDKMKTLHEEKKAKIDAVLTAEQREKHEQMMKEWKEKHKKHEEMEEKEMEMEADKS